MPEFSVVQWPPQSADLHPSLVMFVHAVQVLSPGKNVLIHVILILHHSNNEFDVF